MKLATQRDRLAPSTLKKAIRRRARVFEVFDDCWRVTFRLRLGGTPKQYNQWALKTCGLVGGAGAKDGAYTTNGPQGVALGIFEWNGSPEDIGYLAHECFHATDMILRSRGMVLSDYSDEAWAYLLQSLIGKFLCQIGQSS